MSVGIISAASPGAMPVPDFLHAYLPVSNEKRDGVHVDEVAYAFVKRSPSLAIRSMLGVLIFAAPFALISP